MATHEEVLSRFFASTLPARGHFALGGSSSALRSDQAGAEKVVLYSYNMPIAVRYLSAQPSKDRIYVIDTELGPSQTTKRHVWNARWHAQSRPDPSRRLWFIDVRTLPLYDTQEEHVAVLKGWDATIDEYLHTKVLNRRCREHTRKHYLQNSVLLYTYAIRPYAAAHREQLKGSRYRVPKHPWDRIPLVESALLQMQYGAFNSKTGAWL